MTLPQAEIEKSINDLGYITVISSKIEPSYYKLEDNTIIKATIHVDYVKKVKKDSKSPDGYLVQSANTSMCYVPSETLQENAFQPYTQEDLMKGVIEEDIPVETLRENFSVYKFSNGMTMSIKTIVTQVSRTKFFTPNGESIYMINQSPVLKIKQNIKQLNAPGKYV